MSRPSFRPSPLAWGAVIAGLALAVPAGAQVRSGRFVEWNELDLATFGDGVNHATGAFSIAAHNPPTAWFYAGGYALSDSAVAYVPGVCDPGDITDAGTLDWVLDGYIGHYPVRSLVAFRHLVTGHVAVLRMDGLREKNHEGFLDGTWWFQSDGGGDFSSALHKGSFDGGRDADILLRHQPSQRQMLWMMNATNLGASTWVAPDLQPGWQTVGVDDFDGDNRSDLVTWNETTGAVEFWLMNGATRIGAPVPLANAGPRPLEWRIVATGDVNQDGRPDLLWRNVVTQQLEVWRLNGTTFVGALAPVPDQAVHANWQVVALADFGGDAQPDLLWYNTSSGNLAVWIMDKTFQRTGGMLTNPAGAGNANWKVVAAGDFGVGPAGQGCTNDVLWRNETSGRLVVWHMDLAGQRTAGVFLSPNAPTADPDGAPTSPLEWTVAGPR